MLKVGLISAWHVHAKDYADLLNRSGKVDITAVWDEDPVRGEAWAKTFGAKWYPDYDAFLEEGDFTAVVCDAPTTMHYELLKKAAQANKDIFTEKLLTTTIDECKDLSRIIVDSGITFTICMPVRMNQPIVYVKQLIDEGKLGRITGGRFRRSHNGTSDGWLPDYWYNVEHTGGGAMMDLGAHPVYVLSYLLGVPKRVTGFTSNLFGTSSDENAIGLIEFENGVLATAETAFVTFGVPDIVEIYGTEGSVFVRGADIQVITKRAQEVGVGFFTPSGDTLPEAGKHPLLQFVDACIDGTGTPKHLGTIDAFIMTQIIASIYEADRSNTTINL